MIRGIQHFSTELKTKIDVIPRGCFNVSVWKNNPISIYRDLYIWKIPFDQCLTARTVLPQSTHYLRQLFMARTWLEYGLRLHPPSLPHKKHLRDPQQNASALSLCLQYRDPDKIRCYVFRISVGSPLGQRLRRWPSGEPTLIWNGTSIGNVTVHLA